MLYKGSYVLSLWIKSESVAIEIKTDAKQYLHVVLMSVLNSALV